MLTELQLSKLNHQIGLEAHAAHLYLSMSTWCHYKGFDGCGKFLAQQSEEEFMHMRKLIDYVIETGGRAVIGAIEAPPIDFNSLKAVFEQTFEHEKKITGEINKLVDQFLQDKDYSTFNFLQWYVSEQHEEENLFRTILGKFDLIGDDPRGLFWIDKEVIAMSTADRTAH